MKKFLGILLAICLIVSVLPVMASAAGVATVSIVSDAAAGTMTDYTLTEGQSIYLVNNDAGAASTYEASEDNYTVMLDFPAGGVPTVYLNGAYLASDTRTPIFVKGDGGEVQDFMIVVEDDSTLKSANSAALRIQSTNATITGEGKLTIDAKNGYGIWGYNPAATDENKQTIHEIVFEEANVEVSVDNTEKGWGVGIGGSIKGITIDGGELVLKTEGKVAGLYSMNGDLLITGGANVDISITDQIGISTFNSFVMESGHLKIRTVGTSAPCISGCKDIRILGGTMDLEGPAAAYGVINLDEYEGEYTAVVCQSKDGKGALPYDPVEHNLGYFLSFKLSLGASYEVNVKNGTTDKSVVTPGDTVTITARVAPAGKVFDKWEVNEGNVTLADATATSTTFIMPEENVKITAMYKDIDAEGGDTGDNNNAGNDTNTNTGNDTNTNTGNDTNTNTGNDTNTNTGNDTNTNTGDNNANVNLDDDSTSDGSKKSGKGSGITALLLVLIIVVSIGIGGAGVILFVKLKKAKPETAEEATEEGAEDAE